MERFLRGKRLQLSAEACGRHVGNYAFRARKKVYVIYRNQCLRCEPVVEERLRENPKVEIIYNTNVIKVEGNTELNRFR